MEPASIKHTYYVIREVTQVFCLQFKSLSYIREINSSTCGRSDVTQKPCLVLPFNFFKTEYMYILAEIIISSLTNTALCGPLVNHTKYVYYHNAENFIA